MTIMKEAVLAVIGRRDAYVEAQQYYEGEVPETFATEKLRRAFATNRDHSRLNFCRPIVNAVGNRLEVASIQGDSKKATAKITEVWENNDLGLEAKEIHDNALVYGDAFALVWPDKDGEIQISYESPRQMAMVYDVENPRKKAYAVKIWRSAENISRMTVFGADRITKYYANTGEPNEGTQWTLMQTIANPWGEVPVFHFRTQRPLGRPEHLDAYDAQNAINKLFITNMATIDYQGFPQRWIMYKAGEGDDFADDAEDSTDPFSGLENGAGKVWGLKGADKVGEFSVADAAAFWDPIKDTIRAMSALTDTPLHYFERTGNNPTGNGLRTAEAPLLKKVADREQSFGYTWRDVFRFVLRIEAIPSRVQVFWKTHESLDELERWDLAAKKINAGLSHRQALREGGYSDDQVEQLMAERQAEADGGLFYARSPQTRVNTSHDETTPLQEDAA